MFVSCHLPVVRDGCQAAGQLKDNLQVFSHGADDEKHTREAEGEISRAVRFELIHVIILITYKCSSYLIMSCYSVVTKGIKSFSLIEIHVLSKASISSLSSRSSRHSREN